MPQQSQQWKKGYRAFRDNRSVDECPRIYLGGDRVIDEEWLDGYNEAYRDSQDREVG